jgi:hypothetical protein
MKLSNLFIFNAVVALAFGIGFVLLPATVLTVFGVEISPSVNLAGQLFGVELIAVGLLSWFVRNATDSAVLPGIILALLVADVLGLIVTTMGTLSGVLNTLGWSTVIIYLVLVVGYAYFWLRRDV